MRIPLTLFVSMFFFAVASTAAEPVEDSIVVETDVVYGIVDSIEMKLDIARPSQSIESGRPCIVFIHGGAWRGGNKARYRSEIRVMAEQGYVAASLAYRFCPDHRFPAQVHDVKQAVRFLRSHADQYGIDRQRFGAVGYSAGAHLAMMLGVTDIDDGLEGTEIWSTKIDQPSKVQAVVSYFGPTDFTQGNIPTISIPLLADFIGGMMPEFRDAYVKASPVTFVDSTDAPMLLFQGTADPLVPYQQAILMSEKLSEAGVDGRMELMFGVGHGWGGSRLKDTAEETIEFLNAHLR